MGNNRLYAVRDMDTGKLVSDITNPRKKYWYRKNYALKAIQSGRRWSRYKNLELVVFELIEVEDNDKD